MSKFSKENKYNSDPKQAMIPMAVRFDELTIKQVSEIHNNFSEWVRDAVEEKLIRDLPINNRIKGVK